jgi:serine protease
VRQDVIDALMRVYKLRYGVKYLSPGEVSTLPGEVAGDPRGWIFAHDATTLGGNSGSCVVRYGPRPGVIGLHFAGSFERANYAHATTKVVSGGHLPLTVQEQLTWIEE